MQTLRLRIGLGVIFAMVLSGWGRGQETPAWLKTREPAYPLKTARVLVSADEIAQARANIATYPAAKKVADGIIKAADQWAAWSDDDLIALITDSRVPRAFETGTGGCAKCGHEMYQKFGQYGWIIDPKLPFKVKCPNCAAIFPSNDYAAYYKSDMKEKVGWDSEFVDDGWGWKGPSGEKYWFVAYYNHWMWHKHLVLGVGAMGRAYLLTGDKKYAHKSAVMLHRIAQVYPGMDHAKQSRYGQMMAARGIDYPGKVVNAIWETSLVQWLADTYDAAWETIDTDSDLQKQTGKTGQQIRAFIEANILEDGIDAYFSKKVRGNFGMHQSSLAHLSLVRQFGGTDKWFDELMERSDSEMPTLGLNYALYNLIYRDGIPSESAPGYNLIWVSEMAELGPILQKSGRDVFGNPKVKRLFDGVIDQVVIGKKTPSIGDSADVYGTIVGQNAQAFQTAYRHYKDPRYAAWLESFGAAGENGFKSFESLFFPPVAEGAKMPPAKTRLMDGSGVGFLHNANDTVAMSMTYGFHTGHGHFDRLHFDIFANGQAMTPDLGYPDAMNVFVPGIYTWSKNTIAHNTVTVDAQRQSGNVPGTVEMFADGSFARAMEVDARETYPQCSRYRRNMIMVDVGENAAYFVDAFTVAGSKQHDYSLHGPPGEFELIGGKWGEKQKGTLAGESVELGAFFDRPEMGEKGYSGGFSTYSGSGFQHIFNVQKHEGGEWIGEWKHEKDKEAKVRIRVLEQEGQEVMLADAHVSPVKHPQMLKFIIDRHVLKEGEQKLTSRFVSVIEPFKGDAPVIESAKRQEMQGAGLALAIARAGGESDVVIYDESEQAKKIATRNLTTDARQAVVTFDSEGKAKRVFFTGGTFLEVSGKRYEASAIKGEVVGTEPKKSIVRVKVAGGSVDAAKLVGRVVHFVNDQRKTAHPIAAAKMEADQLVLTTADDLIVGRAKIDTVEPGAVTSNTSLPLVGIYRGTSAMSSDWTWVARVRSAGGGRIEFAGPQASDALKAGEDVWLVNVGEGDRMEVPGVFSWSE